MGICEAADLHQQVTELSAIEARFDPVEIGSRAGPGLAGDCRHQVLDEGRVEGAVMRDQHIRSRQPPLEDVEIDRLSANIVIRDAGEARDVRRKGDSGVAQRLASRDDADNLADCIDLQHNEREVDYFVSQWIGASRLDIDDADRSV